VHAVVSKKIISLHHWNCEQGMKQLEIQVINVIPDQQHAADEEDKISSSSARKRLLGTLLRPPLKVSCATGSIFINMFVYCTIIIQETDFFGKMYISIN